MDEHYGDYKHELETDDRDTKLVIPARYCYSYNLHDRAESGLTDWQTADKIPEIETV